MECARCHKVLKEWMSGCGVSGIDSMYGVAKVCDACHVQEYMEVYQAGPTKPLSYPPDKYDGEPYWKEEELAWEEVENV